MEITVETKDVGWRNIEVVEHLYLSYHVTVYSAVGQEAVLGTAGSSSAFCSS